MEMRRGLSTQKDDQTYILSSSGRNQDNAWPNDTRDMQTFIQ